MGKNISFRSVALLFLFALIAPLFAEGDDIAGTLFHHVLNSNELDLFPLIPTITLPGGVTVHLLMLFISTAVILALFVPSFNRETLKVRGIAVALESIVLFVRDDLVYPIMGDKRGEKWLPFFTTQFLFILTINYLGLIPAFKTATGNINVTSALALIVAILMVVTGFKNLGGIGFFTNMYPDGAPLPIGIFVVFLEVLGLVIKSFVLSLRIFANMFAGHLVILSFLVLIFVLSPWAATISLPFAIFIYLLEILVAFIQAMVFTLLSSIFITMVSSSH